MTQRNLHKPFTGGLGSFKLYVLIGHLLDQEAPVLDPGVGMLLGVQRVQWSPGEALLRFLEHYGRKHDWEKKDTVRSDGGRASAHFGQTFNIWGVLDALRNTLHALHAHPAPTALCALVDPDCVVREAPGGAAPRVHKRAREEPNAASEEEGGSRMDTKRARPGKSLAHIDEGGSLQAKDKGNTAFGAKQYAASYVGTPWLFTSRTSQKPSRCCIATDPAQDFGLGLPARPRRMRVRALTKAGGMICLSV